jgi:MerR family transcriptional regulator, thiopeptide resistance regulator
LTLPLGQGARYRAVVPDRTYKIHELAALAGVTVKALHHYDRIGLLQPRRSAARYRVYSTTDLARLRQILALRSLGLPLRRIRELLSPGAPPLHLTLQHQRHALEERRRVLDRAIRALQAAEVELEAAPDGADAWQALLEVIGMQDSIDEMRKYYSDEVWDRWRHYYEDWPSEAWRTLYRDVNRMLDAEPAPDPLSADAQALGARWLALDKGETTSGAVRTGLRKAWADREHWPASLRSRLDAHRVDRATRFMNSVLWERWEAERVERERGGHPAPARVSDARIELFRACADALAEDPAGDVAQRLVTRWKAIVHAECGGDADAVREQLDARHGRHQWAPAMLRYMASCYAMDPDTWQQATDFLDAACRSARS